MKKLFLIFFCACSFSSCYIDYEDSITSFIKNDCSHDITVTAVDTLERMDNSELFVEVGRTVECPRVMAAGWDRSTLLTVTYDDGTTKAYTDDEFCEHDIRNMANWTTINTAKNPKASILHITFTFTDADYDAAVKANE